MMKAKRQRLRLLLALLTTVALFTACSRTETTAQRGLYLLELEQSLGSGRFEDAVAAAQAGLAQEPHPDDTGRTEEHLRLGGAAALAALGRDAEAVQLLRPLYHEQPTVPHADTTQHTNSPPPGMATPGMATLEAETLAVLIELELRAAELTPALCALEVLHLQRGLEYETLRTAAILYRALDLPGAAGIAEAAASEFAHAYGTGPTRAIPDAESTDSVQGDILGADSPDSADRDTGGDSAVSAPESRLNCSVYGGVSAHFGLRAYSEYLEYRGRAGQLSGPELDRYAELESVLFRFPGYYMGLVEALKQLLPNYSLTTLRPLLERIILLSPQGPYAQVARRELGGLLGIGELHGERLLMGMEIENIASRLFVSGVPETVAPIIELLSTPENPYRSAGRLLLIQAMELPGMRGYLEMRRASAEGELRRALELILASS
ncbi:MAG: hypothetical protein EA428_13405 [Spirochaetaceae bacterium]|nr:MAG: hypothetical protein EA428_13405 [Spirochaetaceae bacterium]